MNIYIYIYIYVMRIYIYIYIYIYVERERVICIVSERRAGFMRLATGWQGGEAGCRVYLCS